MNCETIAELYTARREGELSNAQAEEFAAHLRECPRCAAEVEALDAVVAAVRGLPQAQPPVGLRERIRDAVGEAQAAPVVHADFAAGPKRRRAWAIPAVAAAAVALLFVVSAVRFVGMRKKAESTFAMYESAGAPPPPGAPAMLPPSAPADSEGDAGAFALEAEAGRTAPATPSAPAKLAGNSRTTGEARPGRKATWVSPWGQKARDATPGLADGAEPPSPVDEMAAAAPEEEHLGGPLGPAGPARGGADSGMGAVGAPAPPGTREMMATEHADDGVAGPGLPATAKAGAGPGARPSLASDHVGPQPSSPAAPSPKPKTGMKKITVEFRGTSRRSALVTIGRSGELKVSLGAGIEDRKVYRKFINVPADKALRDVASVGDCEVTVRAGTYLVTPKAQ